MAFRSLSCEAAQQFPLALFGYTFFGNAKKVFPSLTRNAPLNWFSEDDRTADCVLLIEWTRIGSVDGVMTAVRQSFPDALP